MGLTERIIIGIQKRQTLDKEEEQIVTFGVQMAGTVLCTFVVCIGTGFVLHMVGRALFLFVLLLPLRQYAGGFHTKRRGTCALLSYGIYLAALGLLNSGWLNLYVQFAVYGCTVLLILLLAPVDTQNHRLDAKERQVYGERAKMVAVAESGIFMVLYVKGWHAWSAVVVVVFTIVAGLLLAGCAVNTIKNERM